VIAKYGDATSEVLRKVEINEFKRRQGAPVLKVSSKAFGLGRRYPIAKTWKISRRISKKNSVIDMARTITM